MLLVEDYERIRRAVLVEGMTQRKASEEFGHSRETIKKALSFSSPPGYRREKPLQRPAIDPVKDIIDAWLEEDARRPRKQRHTGERIHQRLKEEYGFTGSVSAVRRYIASRRTRTAEVYLPLQFDPGEEAQVDWGEAWFIHNGEMRKVHLFCIRLCHSRASYVRAYWRENMESFLDGHVRAFQFFGGVPRQCAYDNLRCAVIAVGRGRERTLNRRFIELRSHYLFESRFCNVASGNEKGHVENLVKHGQRTFMTPMPECSSLDELNALLEDKCRRDLERLAPRSDRTRSELLEEERLCFLPLPNHAFEACQRVSTFASRQSLARFDTNDYSVPVECALHPVQIKGFVDRVELWTASGLVAKHDRSYDRGRYILSPYHYIPLLERKPGGLSNGRPFKGEPWGEDFKKMRRELEYRYDGEGTKKFIRILLLFAKHPVEEVKRAVGVCVKRRAFSDEAVESVLRFSPPARFGKLDLSDRPFFQLTVTGIRAASEYDQALLAKEACS